LRILLYGRLAEALDRQIELDAPAACSVDAVRQRLQANHPAIAAALARSRAVVGGAAATVDQTVGPGDTIEFLPPVSGG